MVIDKQVCPNTIPISFKVSGIYCISFDEHFYIGSSQNVQMRISQHRKKLRAGKHQNVFQAYYWLYGEKRMYISLLEECEYSKLKSREKYWISTLKPDINHDKIHNTNPPKILFNGTGSKKVYQYTITGEYLAEFPSVMEASRQLGVNSRSIGLCAAANYIHYKSAYGYRWSYKKMKCLPAYENNSSKAVNRQIIVFNVLSGEEKLFESIAEAVRFCNPDAQNFDSDCATLCSCANKVGLYMSKYIAKNKCEDPYILGKRNVTIYNSKTNKLYKNAKVAALDTEIPALIIKKYCKEEDNKEWLYINQCARVKLRESGKIFIER